MARSGLGEHVLIDPDVVSESNIATQQVYRKDIGRPKVECIAERIRDINENAKVVPVRQSLDEIDDAEFKELALKPLAHERPQATLLCGFTDNFEAQARVNRLALHFGIDRSQHGVESRRRRCILRLKVVSDFLQAVNQVLSGQVMLMKESMAAALPHLRARRLKALEDENRRLKRLLADSMLDNAALKDLLGKNV